MILSNNQYTPTFYDPIIQKMIAINFYTAQDPVPCVHSSWMYVTNIDPIIHETLTKKVQEDIESEDEDKDMD